MKVMEMGVLYENTRSLLYKAKVCKMSDKSPKAGASPHVSLVVVKLQEMGL